MSDLIDTTEMYLRTIYELGEEGVPPLRARIAERLGQSGPTVSQTVARMERDGLLTVADDRQIELTPAGLASAVRVMRKHRLAERLLTDVIGLPFEQVHQEACRWEHVISEAVERRLVEVLHRPTASPYGNRIPALGELGGDEVPESRLPSLAILLASQPAGASVRGRVVMLTEHVQADVELLGLLGAAGVVPGADVEAALDGDRLRLTAPGAAEGCTVERAVADHVFLAR
nr:metal-dependent transcriptional regulator [Propionibacterium sp.]